MNEYHDPELWANRESELREELRQVKQHEADLQKQKEAGMKALQVIEALVVEIIQESQQDKRLVGMLLLVKRYVVTQFHEIDAMDIPF